MLYDNRNVAFWGNAGLMLIALLFGVALALAGRRDGGAIAAGRDPEAVALAVTVYHASSHLPELLDTLERTGTPAAFFVSASAVRDAPELVARMRSDGHTVGTLGYAPLYDGDADAMETDVRLAAAGLSACGVRVRYYFSGFRDAAASAKAARALDVRHIRGTRDLRTGAGSAEDILLRAQDVTGGSIVVMQPTAALNQALGVLIDTLSAKYRITTLDSILEENDDTKEA